MKRSIREFFFDLASGKGTENNSIKNVSLPKILRFSKVQDEISYLDEDFSKYCPYHDHDFLEIFYFEKGCGYFETKQEKIKIKANDIIIVNSRNVHRQYSSCEPLVYFNLSIDNVKIKNYEKNTLSDNVFEHIAMGSKKNKIYSLLRKFESDAKKKESYYLHVYSIAYEVLNEIIETLPSVTQKGEEKIKSPLVKKIQEYILENYKRDVTLEEMSKQFFVSKSQLSHCFKTEFGVSPIKYLITKRLDQAKILLLTTEKSITEISIEVGFSDSNYFSYYFSKENGVSPTEFRRIRKR